MADVTVNDFFHFGSPTQSNTEAPTPRAEADAQLHDNLIEIWPYIGPKTRAVIEQLLETAGRADPLALDWLEELASIDAFDRAMAAGPLEFTPLYSK